MYTTLVATADQVTMPGSAGSEKHTFITEAGKAT